MEDRASSVDRLHPPSALCRNRENGRIRKQLGEASNDEMTTASHWVIIYFANIHTK